MMSTRYFTLFLAFLGPLFLACVPTETSSDLSVVAVDEESSLPQPTSMLFWSSEEQISGYRNIDRIFPTRLIEAGDDPYPLPHNLRDLAAVTYEVDGETFDLQGFLDHNRVVGLLAIKNGEIALEHYGHGNTERSKWVSFSIAKSVVSMLMGAAIRDGYVRSVDDPVSEYLPLLEGTAYDGVTLRHVLRMASGVEWNEDYADPSSDVSTAGGSALDRLRFLGAKPRVAPSGERFNYNTGETHLVGGVVRSAIGNNLSAYLSHKIWQPFGMEFDADWLLIEPGGAEHGGCCISATLRDYGRIGLFAMSGGVLRDGTEVLADGWMEESTVPSPAFDGYGYLWWLRGGGFWGIGIFGQMIAIDPEERVVIVTHSAWPRAVGREFSQHRSAFVAALTDALGD